MQVIVAIDRKPNSLANFQPKDDPKYTGGLPNELRLAVGARVMLIRNLDIADGLVNGSQGKVIGFIKSKPDTSTTIAAVLVIFDSPKVGTIARQTSHFSLELRAHPMATPILRFEASFTITRKNKKLTICRYQFPLKLSWSCTIHKVQGLTVSEIVVSFKNRFANGQAYVALSRATSLTGLHILDFQPQKLIASKSVQKEMERLKETRSIPLYYQFLRNTQDSIIISVLNIRSYRAHKQDLLHALYQ